MYSKNLTADLFEKSEVFQEEVETLGAGRRAGRAARKEAAWWGEEGKRRAAAGAKKATAATHGP